MTTTTDLASRVLDLSALTGTVLGVDAGGTKIASLIEDRNGRTLGLAPVASDTQSSLEDLLAAQLLKMRFRPERIACVVAGPRADDGSIKMTNQKGWPVFSPVETSARLGVPIRTYNDMEGLAAGIAMLDPAQLQVLLPGLAGATGARLGLTVSTGVGDAVLLPDGTVVPGEAGHGTWQPASILEFRFLKHLQKVFGRNVSAERAISGKHGFPQMRAFLRPQDANPEVWSDEAIAGKELPKLITAAAMQGDPFAQHAMDLFGSILGQHVRNRILNNLTTGGVFLSGGVMQGAGVAEYVLLNTPFLEALLPAGDEHNDIVTRVPVNLVLDTDVTVKGATALARRG